MYEKLVRQLKACNDANIPCEKADCGYKPFENEDCIENLMQRAVDAIEELSKLAEVIPHKCECCVGCELEEKNGGCDNSFILSPERAKEYLSSRLPKPPKDE